MLNFVVLLSLLSVAYSESDGRPIIHLPAPVHKILMEAASDCIKQTGVKQEISDNFFNLKYESDADTKKFIYCLSRKNNYADEDGHLNERVITLFEGSDRKDDVQKVIDNCNKIKEKDNLETAFQIYMCVYNNTPVLLRP